MILTKFIESIPSNNRLERIWKVAQVDFQSRYYNDRLGLLWAMIKPIFEAILYYFAFKFLLGFKTENFGLFLFGGVITFTVFSECTTRSIDLLRAKSYLIENVQFNHLDLYISHTLSSLYAYLFNLCAFFGMCLIMGQSVTINYFYLPIILLTIYMMMISFSFILSTLQPFLKDITHFWDMSMITGFWISGIFFEPEIILEKAPILIYINPFIGILMNIRGVFLDNFEVDTYWLICNLIFAAVCYLIGYLIYKKYQPQALDKL